MAITEKSIKLLWSNAAGRCSFPGCEKRLTVERAAESAPHTLGEMAHIKGKEAGSNRHDLTQTDKERDGYENLILLCPNHHTEIDKPENEAKYLTAWLLEAKNLHEQQILAALMPKAINFLDDLKDAIAILLAENRQAWGKYGPTSELAQKNPHSNEISEVWKSERLSTIVPNNRVIAKLLNQHRTMFGRGRQDIVSKFLSHTNSYERWVQDEVPYQAVERFPIDFEILIKE
ncbi:HNH endonuclease [Dechloromonas hortensis]|uniref:HNH endonuclease n=1 Tax=Dechloromonas hortensis TaxID=337779 RepID=UPI0012915BBD|nr:HNH endonuclease [Dechloromonas hortensis]